jgi:hypothetical protein
MADEFVKGLGVLTGAGMVWMVLAGWYNTPSFEAAEYPQMLAPNPDGLATLGSIALTLKDVMLWFAIIGALVFWIVIPAVREARANGE